MDTVTFTSFWQFFHMYRTQLGYGILAALVNALSHWKRHDSARDSFVDILFCGAIGWGADAVLLKWDMPSNTAVIVAAMVGYIGAQGISDLLKAKLGFGAKKTETSATQ